MGFFYSPIPSTPEKGTKKAHSVPDSVPVETVGLNGLDG